MVENISWLGHSSIKITGNKTIYIDPWKLNEKGKADVILVSHSHRDHLSIEDVNALKKEDTVIITTADCAEQISGDVRVVKPGDILQLDNDTTVEAVPSYNPDKQFHPKSNNWLGFIITIAGKRIYYCGDTDIIPEMKAIKADIIITPVGGTYTMTAEDAAKMVNMIKPETAIPIHYGDIVGSEKDAKRFKELCNVPVVIKPFVVNN